MISLATAKKKTDRNRISNDVVVRKYLLRYRDGFKASRTVDLKKI